MTNEDKDDLIELTQIVNLKEYGQTLSRHPALEEFQMKACWVPRSAILQIRIQPLTVPASWLVSKVDVADHFDIPDFAMAWPQDSGPNAPYSPDTFTYEGVTHGWGHSYKICGTFIRLGVANNQWTIAVAEHPAWVAWLWKGTSVDLPDSDLSE